MRPTTLPALLLSAVVTGLLCAGAVAVAPGSVRTPLSWGAASVAVLLTAAVTAAAHGRDTARRLRARNAALADEAARRAAEAARAREEAARAREETARAREDAARSETNRAAAVAACANAAGRMQALATSMLADLRAMEHRHTDEDVLADLLQLDHRTAQAGRLADSVAVLTGARSGRRWAKPIVMESILRGAMGRIGGYQRVRLHCATDAAIAGHAAEGVMHALAELLDNAANFSPPTAEVHVYVEEVAAGLVVAVEDSGLVMSEVQLRRAERAVGAAHTDLTGLSGTRLGLAVVGRLARKHGLTVSFRPSARGGTGVLVMIPQELVTRARPEAPPTRRPATKGLTTTGTATPAREATAPAPVAPAPVTPAPVAPATPQPPATGDALPRRRRGQTLAAAHPDGAPPPLGTPPSPSTPVARPAAKAAAARFHSFRQAVRTTTEGTSE
ncbi:ATP-binding protein [Streptomyces sp. NPDC006368]|uniref:sensor histidine kinase n=1 Tax=Streptomyces sp. NPDC006368 TaxID=3156760 RepID=UPI0033B9F05C